MSGRKDGPRISARSEMRLHALVIALAAGAVPVAVGHEGEHRRSASRVGCIQLPSRLVWESAGYVTDGKWRPAHCAPRDLLD
jgi:hypothetical protein